jgi:PAS domain S-box-containing protein
MDKPIKVEQTGPEAELRESRKRLQLALNAAQLGVWEWDLRSDSMLWSPECSELAGVDEFGANFTDFERMIHPDDRKLVRDNARDAIEEHKIFDVEFRIIDSRGAIRWLSDHAAVEYDDGGEAIRMTGTVQDITERKNGESLVRQSEENFRALIQASSLFTWTAREDGSSEELFDWFSALSGKKINEFRDIGEIIHPEDLECAIREWRTAFETRSLFSNVSRFRTAAGEYCYIATRAVQVFNEDGSFRQWIGTFNDITQRMLAEKAIRESEALNRVVLDSMLSNIAVLDPTGNIKAVNNAWRNFATENGGASPEAATAWVGWNYLDVCDRGHGPGEDIAATVASAIREIMEGTRQSFSTEYPCDSPERKRWFHVNISRLQTSDSGVVVSHSDISDRKAAEEALRKNEAQLQLVADTVPTLIARMDIEQRCVFANEAFLNWHGRTSADTIGRHISEILGPDAYAQMLPEIESVLSGRAFSLERHSFVHENRFLRFTYVPDRGIGGEAQGFFIFTVDLTDNKLAEERLLYSEEQLRQSQKLESIGRLAGGIAHDFNNMLTAINGYSELALMKLAPEDPVRRNIEEIKKAGERSAALTHQLLAFSRRQLMELTTLSPNKVIADAHIMLQRVIGEDINIDTILSDDLWCVTADAGLLTQILLNLVVNARDAMPQGGNIVICSSNVFCDSDFVSKHPGSKVGEFVRIAVSDTGTGIDEETKKHIFEPFFTTKPTGKGTGLGLSMVYGSVKQLDGYVWVSDNSDGGTTFEIFLPRTSADVTLREPSYDDNIVDANETILLVEDEPIVRELSRQLLESCGYRVIEASDGPEAMELHKGYAGKIDLLLTDVVMPQMSGRELADELLRIQPDLKVLFASGYIDNSSWEHGTTDATARFIQKPFTYETLARRIREILG